MSNRSLLVFMVIVVLNAFMWLGITTDEEESDPHNYIGELRSMAEAVTSTPNDFPEERPVQQLGRGHVSDGESVNPPECMQSISSISLFGNRPVGTYICDYFSDSDVTPTTKGAQCSLRCNAGLSTAFFCHIFQKASKAELKTADIVVNHYGPVPKRYRDEQITLFYTGESNATQPALAARWNEYTHVVSFHSSQRFYFTWTHRFALDFNTIALHGVQGGMKWSQRLPAIAVFVSRCKGGRDTFIRSLGKFFTVHSFGKCSRTHAVEDLHPECHQKKSKNQKPSERYAEKICVFKKYKYVLALENTNEVDYVTEKVYHALLAGAIPIYDGAPNVNSFVPGGSESLILLSNFASTKGWRDHPNALPFDDLIRLLHRISPEETPHFFKWQTNSSSWSSEFHSKLSKSEPTCDVCDEARHLKCIKPNI